MGLFTFWKKQRQPQAPLAAPAAFLAGVVPGLHRTPPPRGTAGLLEAYATMPWLHAITNKVSRSVATTPWRLLVVRGAKGVVHDPAFQRGDFETRQQCLKAYRQSKAADVQEIEAHPLLDFLSAGNPFFPGTVTQQLTQIYLDLVGEAYWLKERNAAGIPIAAWPLPPTWILQLATPGAPVYRVSFRGWQGEIPASEILRFVHPSPANPYDRGAGTARALGDELETDELTAKHLKQVFFNQARPDLIVSGEDLSPANTERLEQRWTEKLQGFWKVAKPFFLSGKIDVQVLQPNFQHLQLTELRRHERDTILQVFAIPPEQMGIVESSNRATIEASMAIFQDGVVKPRKEFQREVLQQFLVPEFDPRLILDYQNPVQEDRDFRLKAAQLFPWAVRVDEARDFMSLPPLPDGDGQRFGVPFTLSFVDGFGGQPPPAPLPPSEAALRVPAVVREAIAGVVREEIARVNSEKKCLVDSQTVKSEGKANHYPLSTIHCSLTDADLDAILAVLLDTSLILTLIPEITATVEHFGALTLAEIGSEVAFDLSAPAVVDFLRTQSVTHVKDLIDATTREELRASLADGVQAGETMAQLAARIGDVFEAATGSRSVNIATTEVTRASSFGVWAALQQAGIAEKEFLSTRDEKVRDTHRELDGQRQPLSADFQSPSGDHGPYPGGFQSPAENCRCRCTLIGVYSKTIARGFLDTEAKRDRYWKGVEAQRAPFDRRMERAAIAGFAQQEAAVLQALHNATAAGATAVVRKDSAVPVPSASPDPALTQRLARLEEQIAGLTAREQARPQIINLTVPEREVRVEVPAPQVTVQHPRVVEETIERDADREITRIVRTVKSEDPKESGGARAGDKD